MKRTLVVAVVLVVTAGCSSTPAVVPAAVASTPSAAAVVPAPSASPTPIPTASATPTWAAEVYVNCEDDEVDDISSSVAIPVKGTADFSDVWSSDYTSCTATRSADPLTAIEKAAAKAGKPSGDSLTDLYGLCGANDPDDVYAEADFVMSGEQIPEALGALLLCPNHPHAAAWRKSIARGSKQYALEKSGRSFGAGVYRVGKEIKPGTYVVTGDIEDCYWERQNRNGGIIANDFIDAAKRVQVTIRAGDYSFNSTGCGQWEPAK